MGRGIGYNYDHFILYDDDMFNLYDGETKEFVEWDEWAFEDFKRTINLCFNAESCKKYDGDKHFFGENDRLMIGIDSSGGLPCVFLEPKWYSAGSKEKEYNIDRDAKAGFNRLLKEYPTADFRLPSSAWTSYRISKY